MRLVEDPCLEEVWGKLPHLPPRWAALPSQDARLFSSVQSIEKSWSYVIRCFKNQCHASCWFYNPIL